LSVQTSELLISASHGKAPPDASDALVKKWGLQGMCQGTKSLLGKLWQACHTLANTMRYALWTLWVLVLCSGAMARDLELPKVGQQTLHLTGYLIGVANRSGAATFDLAYSDKGELGFKAMHADASNAYFDRSSSAHGMQLTVFYAGDTPSGRSLDAEAMRYGCLAGLCAALALVFGFLWIATKEKVFAWCLATVLAATWRIAENSGQLPALLPWDTRGLAIESYLLAHAALLFFTVGLLLHALGRQTADLPIRRILYAAGAPSLVLAALTPWPLLAAPVLQWGLPLAYGVLVLLTAWRVACGARDLLWYGVGLLVPLLSLFLQHLQQDSWSGHVVVHHEGLDVALVQAIFVLAGAVAHQEMRKRQTQIREMRASLHEQNTAFEKVRQAEINLELQVSQRTQELATAAQRLEALSTVDGMTGVANRRRFDETLQVEWGRAARDKCPLSVALIDVDWFKSYNDRYGHPAGDACLRQLARVFEAGVMRSGDLIARYGGEEFVLIAPDTDLNGIHTIARYLCQEVFALALEHEDSPYGRVSVSIGVATAYPHRGSKPLQLVEQADAALYRAKQQGRHRVGGPQADSGKA